MSAGSLQVFVSLVLSHKLWQGAIPTSLFTPDQLGNITQLKRDGLLVSVMDEGCSWLRLTAAGKTHAAVIGLREYVD